MEEAARGGSEAGGDVGLLLWRPSTFGRSTGASTFLFEKRHPLMGQRDPIRASNRAATSGGISV